MGVCSAAVAAIAGKPAPTGKFFIIRGVAMGIMKVGVKNITDAAVNHGFGRFANRPCSVSEWK